MEILLIVAIVAVGAAGLYVAATFNRRTTKSTAPLINDAVNDAVKKLSEQIEGATGDLGRQLQAITTGLQHDRNQVSLDDRNIQDRLDRADSRILNVADQLETIRRLVEHIGARQDILSAELAAQRADGRAGEETTDTVPARRVPVVPAQLYVFGIIHTPAQPQVRIHVERYAGKLPTGQLGDPGDASAIIHRAEQDEGFSDRLSEAASDYLATLWEDPAFALVTEQWRTLDTFPETMAAEVCNRIANELNAIVEKPLEKIGTVIRLPELEASTVAGIGSGLILQPVTEPLAQLAKLLEIAGVVVGVALGLHPVALTAAKMLAHDESHAAVARGIREAARLAVKELAAPARAPEPRPVDQAPATSAPPVPAQPGPHGAPAPNPPPLPPPTVPRPPPPGPKPPGWPQAPGRPGPGLR
jgi:hypothetical protein